MNMPNSVKITLWLLPFLAACTEKENLSYGLQDQVVYEDKTQKTKRKSESEYISILYTNLYQQPISPNQLYKTQQVVQSIGDRTLAWEMLLSNYFNKPGIQMPDETFMRAETDSFINMAYRRFYLRRPGEAERAWFRNFIRNRSDATVEMVFTAFAASDEYAFY
jgi:hypothetical protein